MLDTLALEQASSFPSSGKRMRQSIAHLCRLAIEMSRAEDRKTKLELALKSILQQSPLNHAAILLRPVDSERLDAKELVAAAYASQNRSPSIYQRISDFLAQTVMESRNAVIARHVRGDSILGRRNSQGIIETTSVICAPIVTAEKLWGLIHVYSTDAEKVPDEHDLDFTLGVAEILAVSMENWEKQFLLAENLTRARNENADLRKRLGVQSEIVGSSRCVAEITEQIAMAARTRSTVLIHGESGVGKELVARAVHYSSQRKKNPFICLNCAALSEDLLASELFGHERGAFTGATDKKIGKFEAANGGSLMLDEIGEMSLNIQAKFLRVLEGHPFERVGGNKPIHVDVRVIAATNRDLEKEVLAGRFRKDLFFRLRVIEIRVPPLRERASDILELAEHFCIQFRNETGKKILGFSTEAEEKLTHYSWPGNIRELKNVIERAVVFARGTRIEAQDLLLSKISTETPIMPEVKNLSGKAFFHPQPQEAVELEHIRQTLLHTQGNKSKAAALLGIERTTLDRKLKKMDNG
ncbi:MAG: sigma-54-dependent Fis family transcriptional regulator [Planctomycetia bacterium]|nr:sigma-54-dependent Fis family transcriptional regulator [Planctomycetia bacterium]